MPKRLILYVDDDPLQLAAMVERLDAELDWRVIPAATIEDGIHLIDRHARDLDLVITDMHFGDEDKEGGLKIVEHASKGRKRYLPVIVLTGKGNTANAVKSMEAGAFSYVEKLLEDDATVALLIYKAAHAFKRHRLEAALKAKGLQDRAKSRRIAFDLKRAKSLQSSFWPLDPLRTPNWEVYGRCEPCDEIGGDFYSFVPTSDDAISVIIGDAMGHGVSAALLAASIKSALDSARITDPRSEAVCARLLETLILTPPFSATLFYAHLAPSGNLTYFSAGHPAALILRTTGEAEPLKSTGPLLSALILKGIGPPLAVSEAQLMPGDRLIIYTDGIVEATNNTRKEYGVSRLSDTAADARALSPKAALQLLFSEVNHFTQDNALDDKTIVIADYL